jgi:energy-coupling factor transporter ATP-binding protein EcfA2
MQDGSIDPVDGIKQNIAYKKALIYQNLNLLETQTNILLLGSEGCGKSKIIETIFIVFYPMIVHKKEFFDKFIKRDQKDPCDFHPKLNFYEATLDAPLTTNMDTLGLVIICIEQSDFIYKERLSYIKATYDNIIKTNKRVMFLFTKLDKMSMVSKKKAIENMIASLDIKDTPPMYVQLDTIENTIQVGTVLQIQIINFMLNVSLNLKNKNFVI